MFDVIKNKIGKKHSSKESEFLIAACGAMEERDPGIAKEVSNFILSGDPSSCLQRVEALGPNRHALRPGACDIGNISSWEELDEHSRKVLTSIPSFMASSTGAQPEILRRLALVIHACCGDVYYSQRERKFEGWFGNFLDLLLEQVTATSSEEVTVFCPDRSQLIEIARRFSQPIEYVDAFILGKPSRNRQGYILILRKETDWISVCAQPQFHASIEGMISDERCTLAQLLLTQSRDSNTQLPISTMPVIAGLLASNSKDVRATSQLLIAQCQPEALKQYIQQHYSSQKSTTRLYWLQALANQPDYLPLYDQWLAVEKAPKVREQLVKLQQLAQVSENASANQDISIPPVPEFQLHHSLPESWLDEWDQARQQLIHIRQQALVKTQKNLEKEIENKSKASVIERYKENIKTERSIIEGFQQVTAEDFKKYHQYLQSGKEENFRFHTVESVDHSKILKKPEIKFISALRHAWESRSYSYKTLANKDVSKLCLKEISDFRQLCLIYKSHDKNLDDLISSTVFYPYYDTSFTPPEYIEHMALWPFFAENPEYIDSGLNGMIGSKRHYDENAIIAKTIYFLGQFPTIHLRWKQRLYEYAIGSNKQLRSLAQHSAEKLGVDYTHIQPALVSRSKETRSVAAKWLSQLRLSAAKKDLIQAINKEKDLSIKTLLLDSLEQCGGDISEFLTPEVLLSEAQAGLKKAIPKTMVWFPRESLPKCYFVDGKDVPPELVFWWIVLSVKLKMPETNPIFVRYFSLLSKQSQQQLSFFILSAFIHEDTRGPSDEEAHQYAEINKHQQHKVYLQWAHHYEWASKYKDITLAQTYDLLYQGQKSQLAGSAIKDKGMLALIFAGDPNELLSLIQPYIKKHYVRRAQIESFLMGISSGDNPIITQFLLSLARRYRTASVQQVARDLVSNIATRNHWSPDELADRTIQTAGFEHTNAEIEFEYGNRLLTMKLSDDLKLQLLNEQGKVIKSLPQPRQDDDQEAIKETRKWFSNCKKELKQVMEQQSNRLFEAMLTERHWPASDWLKYLHQHPLMNRLLQRSLWQVHNNNEWASFRPSEDGEFIDLDDEEIQLNTESTIRLVSGNQLDDETRTQWKQHLKDYRVKPLFDQLKYLELDLTDEQLSFSQYKGYVTDAFTVRGTLTKLGYQRGEAQDAGWFGEYEKAFDSLGLTACITFSGNCLPEENVTAAIFEAHIEYQNSHKPFPHGERKARLKDLPENLVNALALDYQVLSQKASFDPQWEKKIPW